MVINYTPGELAYFLTVHKSTSTFSISREKKNKKICMIFVMMSKLVTRFDVC